jgi:prephenate dehydratase
LQATIDKIRVAFQGEAGAFSEAAAVQLLGEEIVTVPRPTFDATFRAISEGAADALLVPVENSLAGSVVRVYDLLLESELTITAETILPIEMNLIACPGASLHDIRTISSHPMALAQCERFFGQHPHIQRLPAEDTAGSVREVLVRGDKTHAAIAGKRAAVRYRGEIIAERIQDNTENFTRFVLLQPAKQALSNHRPEARKMSPWLTAFFPRAVRPQRREPAKNREPPDSRPPVGISVLYRCGSRHRCPPRTSAARSARSRPRGPRPRFISGGAKSVLKCERPTHAPTSRYFITPCFPTSLLQQ